MRGTARKPHEDPDTCICGLESIEAEAGDASAMLSHSVVFDSATPWTVAFQAPLFMRFSRQEYWTGLPSFPFPGGLPDPGIEPGSPALQADSLLSEPLFPTVELLLALQNPTEMSLLLGSLPKTITPSHLGKIHHLFLYAFLVLYSCPQWSVYHLV